MSYSKFSISNDVIVGNFTRFMEMVENIFGELRVQQLLGMYEALGDNIVLSPASSYEHFHNATNGGYFDHVLRVTNFATLVYKQWESVGLDVSNFTIEELMFSAMHHDLGKLGFEGLDGRKYVENTSSWHYEKLGRCYEINDINPYMNTADQSLFLLQKYGVTITLNEMLGIKLTDGLYDEANIPYLKSASHQARLRTNLPLILHQADMMAAQYEYEKWGKVTGKSFPKIVG